MTGLMGRLLGGCPVSLLLLLLILEETNLRKIDRSPQRWLWCCWPSSGLCTAVAIYSTEGRVVFILVSLNYVIRRVNCRYEVDGVS